MKSSEDADMTKDEKALYAQTDDFVSEFERSMEDDFNTADAMAAIFELVKFVNIALRDAHTKDFIEALKERMDILLDVMGLNALIEQGDLSDEIEAMIEKRQRARKARDFATADAIRDELKVMGIVLEDTAQGVKWHRG